jgi:hypothetical protein
MLQLLEGLREKGEEAFIVRTISKKFYMLLNDTAQAARQLHAEGLRAAEPEPQFEEAAPAEATSPEAARPGAPPEVESGEIVLATGAVTVNSEATDMHRRIASYHYYWGHDVGYAKGHHEGTREGYRSGYTTASAYFMSRAASPAHPVIPSSARHPHAHHPRMDDATHPPAIPPSFNGRLGPPVANGKRRKTSNERKRPQHVRKSLARHPGAKQGFADRPFVLEIGPGNSDALCALQPTG